MGIIAYAKDWMINTYDLDYAEMYPEIPLHELNKRFPVMNKKYASEYVRRIKAETKPIDARNKYRTEKFYIEGNHMATHNTEVVSITGIIKFETAKAILFIPSEDMPFEDEDAYTKGVWFPSSQCKEIHHGIVGEDGTVITPARLVVTRWIATQKGMM